MNSILNSIRYFIFSSWQQKKDIINIIIISIKVTFLVRYIPLRLYVSKFASSDVNKTVELQPLSKEISLIRKVLRHVPWKITCLMECLIVKQYLTKFGFNLTVSIGVNKKDNLNAHAWYGGVDEEKYVKLLCL